MENQTNSWQTVSARFKHPRWGLVVAQRSTDGRYRLLGKGCYGGSQIINAPQAEAEKLITDWQQAWQETPFAQDSSTRALEEVLDQRKLMQERAELSAAMNQRYGKSSARRQEIRYGRTSKPKD